MPCIYFLISFKPVTNIYTHMNTRYPFRHNIGFPISRYYYSAYKQKTPQSLAGPVLYRIRLFNLFLRVTRPANCKATYRTPSVKYFNM